MTRTFWGAMTCAAVLIAAAGQAWGGVIVNGGFETGDYTGWSTLGDTSIETSTFNTGPAEGTYQALMTSGTGSVADTVVETFLGVAPGTLDTLSTGNATEGSVIKQTVAGNAGDILSFTWNFLTDEIDAVGDYNDFAFWSLVNLQNGTVIADTHDGALTNSLTVFDDETGFFTTSFSLVSSGSFVLGFGVADTDDTGFDSGLLIDNVNITPDQPVPEPTSLALLGLGSVGLIGAVRRRRRRMQVA